MHRSLAGNLESCWRRNPPMFKGQFSGRPELSKHAHVCVGLARTTLRRTCACRHLFRRAVVRTKANPKGPCTHIAYTWAPKYLNREYILRPMYILCEYIDPQGKKPRILNAPLSQTAFAAPHDHLEEHILHVVLCLG